MVPGQSIDADAIDSTEAENAAAVLVAAAAGEDVALAGGEVEGDGANVAIGEGAGARLGWDRGSAGWCRRFRCSDTDTDTGGRSDPRKFPPHIYDHRTARGCSSSESRAA